VAVFVALLQLLPLALLVILLVALEMTLSVALSLFLLSTHLVLSAQPPSSSQGSSSSNEFPVSCVFLDFRNVSASVEGASLVLDGLSCLVEGGTVRPAVARLEVDDVLVSGTDGSVHLGVVETSWSDSVSDLEDRH